LEANPIAIASGVDGPRIASWNAGAAAFQADHVRPVILLLMRFDATSTMQRLREGVLRAGDRYGYDVVRADDRDYTGELWTNVDLCVRNAQLVVAVLEDIERRDCDANVMVELGYALGLSRTCLLLKERRLPHLPAVLGHRITQTFDAHDLPSSVERAVASWLRHLGSSSEQEGKP
jgi:hypothetical protein